MCRWSRSSTCAHPRLPNGSWYRPSARGSSSPLPPPAERPGLPPLWCERRRIYLGALVAAGLVHAAAAGVGGLVVARLLQANTTANPWPLVSTLVLIAVVVGGIRATERVV